MESGSNLNLISNFFKLVKKEVSSVFDIAVWLYAAKGVVYLFEQA